MKLNINFLVAVFLILSTFYSCQKEDTIEVRELNITYKTTEAIEPLTPSPNITFYPNPFNDYVNMRSYYPEGEILIANQSGGMKKISFNNANIAIDFTNEKSGVYYCEVYVNGIVFRNHIIKL